MRLFHEIFIFTNERKFETFLICNVTINLNCYHKINFKRKQKSGNTPIWLDELSIVNSVGLLNTANYID